MKKSFSIFSKPAIVIYTAFITAWLSNLAYTDSLFSVYVLCALIGIFSLCSNYYRKPTLTTYISCILIATASIFSFVTVTANYRIFATISDPLVLFNLVCTLIGGIILGFNLLVCIYDRLPYSSCPDFEPSKFSVKYIFAIFMGSIIVVDLVYLFFVQYPGIMTNDSYTQVKQILSGQYTNHHPFWHTMVIKVCYYLGTLISENINACATIYAVLQIIILASSFSYALTTMYQLNVPKRLIYMAWFVFAMMPYNIAFSVCMNKDYLFSAAVLAFTVSMYRILKDVGYNSYLNYFIFFVSGIACCIWRSNGIIAFVFCTVFFAFFFWKRFRYLLAAMIAIVTLGWVMTNPMLSSMNITQPDLVESLSIPVQQVARVVYDGCEISTEDYDLINLVVDIEEIPELYTDWLSDPIKDEIRSKNNSFFEENISEYLELWVRLGIQHPIEYVKAWIDQTKGYWNGGYDFSIYALGVGSNDLGFTDGLNNNIIAKVVNLMFKFCRGAIFIEPFESIGLHVWLLFTLFVINWLKGRQEMLLSVLPLAIVGTLLIATPVYSAFRYAYPVFTTYPFILAVSICKKTNS